MPCQKNASVPTVRCLRKKEDEKVRSKANRQHFKGLIEQLNSCVSNTKLNKNSTLETAVAMVKLDSFYNPNQISEKMANRKRRLIDVNHFLNITNSVGLGFLKSGVIVYATEQLISYFKEIKNLIGTHLSKICYNSEDIIRRVWVENHRSFLVQVKGNYKAKSAFDICITGKQMCSTRSETMFLGYSKSQVKPFHVLKNPSLAVTGCYMITSLALSVIKGHPYIDYITNTQMSGTASAMYPHPEDMAVAPMAFQELRRTGFVETNTRLLRKESDGGHRWIHCIITMTTFRNDATNEEQIGSLVWPYAISKDGKHFTENDMEMLNMNPVLGRDLNAQTKQFTSAVAQSQGIFGQSRKPDYTQRADVAPFVGKGKHRSACAMPSNYQQQDITYCCDDGGTFQQFPAVSSLSNMINPSAPLLVKVEPEVVTPCYNYPPAVYFPPPYPSPPTSSSTFQPKRADTARANPSWGYNNNFNTAAPVLCNNINLKTESALRPHMSPPLKQIPLSTLEALVPSELSPTSGSPLSANNLSFEPQLDIHKILDDFWADIH